MTKQLILLLIISSVVACAKRPDSDVCVVNAPAKHSKCYNLLHDYDDEGNLKHGAAATFKPANTIDDLNKAVWTDSEKGWPNLQIYIGLLRQHIKELESGLKECRANCL